MYRISFYVPASHLNEVKQALFALGVGQLGDYEHCAWQTKGQGQFRPLSGSSPFIGTTDTLETTEEYKVEMVCPDALIKHALTTLCEAHPYEEPAYAAYRILTLADFD